MHVFCSYSCAVKRKMVPKATTCFFLGYAQSGYRCYDVKSKRCGFPLNVLFNLMRSPHIFFNLINPPRGRMVMEMYCGLLLFINSNLILLQLMLRISPTLQASCFAQHLLPIVSLFSWPRRIPVTRHSMFILGGDYIMFPRLGLLQKISSLALLCCFPSSRFLRFWIPLSGSSILSSFLSCWRIFVLSYK